METDVETFYESDSLAALPNELLLQVLTPMSSLDLLPLAAVCQRFHNLVVRILTYRIALASGLNGNSLLLECYAPAQRLTEPHLSCTHVETQGLDEALQDQDAAAAYPPGYILKQLRRSYSVFQLHRKARKRIPYKHPAGDIPGSRTYTSRTSNAETDADPPTSDDRSRAGPPGYNPGFQRSNSKRRYGSVYEAAQSQAGRSSSSSSSSQDTQLVYEPVIQHAHLEAGVLFNQLCAETCIAITAPFTDTFIGFQDVTRGVLRVWRHWLADRAAEQAPSTSPADDPVSAVSACDTDSVAVVESPPAAADSKGKQPCSDPAYNPKADDRILWVGHEDTVGIRFGVREIKWRSNRAPPVLMHVDEDPPISYELQYNQLLVRTSDLLLASERADARRADTGKAIVFGKLITSDS